MNEKIANDAVAFIRGIAEKRSRNIDWAEKAVRYSLSITATDALDQNVIDLVSPSTTKRKKSAVITVVAMITDFEIFTTSKDESG